MNENLDKIALGGGCHWCTEAVFQSLIGVAKVEQGYVASKEDNHNFSEAVIVHFDAKIISLKTLIEIHLYTHRSTSNHSMRKKYVSAIYVFTKAQKEVSKSIIKEFQKEFDNEIITKVLFFQSFKTSRVEIQNYYQRNPAKPFCEQFINPKLKLLLDVFSSYVNEEKVMHLKRII